jgi:7-carboxy-7-deazaguanine synthase
VSTEDYVYPVNDMYPTIQGEGTQTGVPMVLIRLHGCPVGCPFCDTKETWGKLGKRADTEVPTLAEALGTTDSYVNMLGAQVARAARAMGGGHVKWVLLTGGEPGMYPLGPLVRALQGRRFKVACETSGTVEGVLPVAGAERGNIDWLTVSPKLGMPGGRIVRSQVLQEADEIKFVVGKDDDLDTIKHVLMFAPPETTVCVQPMSQSEKATALCVKWALEYGWRVSVQVHKVMAVR